MPNYASHPRCSDRMALDVLYTTARDDFHRELFRFNMFPCQEGMPLLRLEGTGTQSFDRLENKCFKIFQAPPGVKYSDLRQFLDLKGDR